MLRSIAVLLFIFLQILRDCLSFLTFCLEILLGINEQGTSSLTFPGLFSEERQVDQRFLWCSFQTCYSCMNLHNCCVPNPCWKRFRSASGPCVDNCTNHFMPLLIRGPRKIPVTVLHLLTFHLIQCPFPPCRLPSSL